MYIFKELLQYSADGHRQLVKYYEDFELPEECIFCLPEHSNTQKLGQILSGVSVFNK